MTALALPSLEVQGFRGFQNLRIEKFSRVNLIVGKNNIGKSSLLEAIQLYATRAHPACLWQILVGDNEDPEQYQWQTVEEALSFVKYLFFDRKEITGPTDAIKIGPVDNLEQQLRISLDFFTIRGDPPTWQILSPEEYGTAESPTLRFAISLGADFCTSYSLLIPYGPNFVNYAKLLHTRMKRIDMVSVRGNGLNKQEISQMWDSITFTDYGKEVLNALQIVAPGVEEIDLVAQFTHNGRIPIIKAQEIPEPFPMRTLGDGMHRMLGIILALGNARDGVLLIDEFENGIYYSVQEDLWKLVFQLAHQLNVQIFATTHSWDCIRAFQKAVAVEGNEEGLLIRLEFNKDDDIVTTVYDKRKLTIATRGHIEVR